MRDPELVELRQRVDCRTVLEQAGWQLDAGESSRRAAKYREGKGRIIIVTHEGKGWFDPLNDKRGDVLALAQHLWGVNLGGARKRLRPLAGIHPRLLPVATEIDAKPFDTAAWHTAAPPCPGSPAWRYLTEVRAIPAGTLHRAVEAGRLREGIFGTCWGAHTDPAGAVIGWEMRGPRYKGFAAGGHKALFWIGAEQVDRVVVCEGMIDAMSLAALEGWRPGSLYASTGGGWRVGALTVLGSRCVPHARLVAATDRGTGGEILARRLAGLAGEAGMDFARLLPEAKDWNDQLRLMTHS